MYSRLLATLTTLWCAASLSGVAAAAPVQAPAAPPPPAMAPAPTPPQPAQGAAAAGQPQAAPVPPLPPAGSPPILRDIELRFYPYDPSKPPGERDQSMVDAQTYLYYMKVKIGSQPSKGVWVPYNEADEQGDFQRLWNTHFLDNLWLEVIDDPYPNGVDGKHVVFHMEERQRVKIVDYTGSKQVEISKIEDALRDKGLEIRLDSFVDQTVIRKVKTVIQDLYAEKGYQAASVDVKTQVMAGGPKLIHLTFDIDAGPKYEIEQVNFVGNKAFSDGDLEGQMKTNKAHNWLSWVTNNGTFQEDKFAEDAQAVIEYYQNHGYVNAQVGAPQIEVLHDSGDEDTRYIRLRIPVDEGLRYRVGTVTFAENTVVKSDVLRTLFKLQPGDFYNRQAVEKGYDKARELYGTGGYYEFTGYPELNTHGGGAAANGGGPAGGTDSEGDSGTAAGGGAQAPAASTAGPPIVDVVLHMQEGTQYFIHHISFTGNTTTRDQVIRRELNIYEGGVFNTEALKYSIRRLNQLGYFKALDSNDAIQVAKAPGTTNQVDVGLKFQEQNRNQITFGAGVSQLEGFFGQLAFQTSNFLGRGETVSVSLQEGSLAKDYEVGFTEPFLFDRPITAGVNLFNRDIVYLSQFTETSEGGTTTVGLPIHPFSRFYLGYSFEKVGVQDINPAYLTPAVLASNPYLADELLVDQNGHRTIGKISPSFVLHNTINEPIFPMTGTKYTLGMDIAGMGGNTQFVSGSAEGIWYIPFTKKTSLAIRLQSVYIRPYGDTHQLPIFEKIFLGGEYSIRGFDIRSIGPVDPVSGLVVGGNKSLLFNAEYIVAVAGPVRVLGFYDAGEVRDVGQPFVAREPIIKRIAPTPYALSDPYLVAGTLLPVDYASQFSSETTGDGSAIKTSTGLEVRFFMPVLNVPFRLIMAYNPQRAGVLNNNGVQTPRFTFRFAVGTTF